MCRLPKGQVNLLWELKCHLYLATAKAYIKSQCMSNCEFALATIIAYANLQ